MTNKDINVAIVGIGNCASSLIQGLSYYKHATSDTEYISGLIHPVIEKYKISSPYRKPGIGMILEASEKHNIALEGSYLIGDSYSDIKCGLNAGTKTILVLTGYGKTAYKKCLDEKLKINFIADNLSEAVKYIEENDA